MGEGSYEQTFIEQIVTACGVTPRDNYLLVKQRMSTARLMMGMMFKNGPQTDQQRAQFEDDIVLIFTASGILSVNLSKLAQAEDKQMHPQIFKREDVTALAVSDTSDQICLHFNYRGKQQNYYVWRKQPQVMQYVLTQFSRLQKNRFLSFASGETVGKPVKLGAIATPTMPNVFDLMNHRNTPQGKATDLPKHTPPSGPTKHEDISAEYRPERTYRHEFMSWFKGPKRS